MKTTIRIATVSLAAASITMAATSKPEPLTPKRIAELTRPGQAAAPKAYRIEVSGLQRPSENAPHDSALISVTLPADRPQALLECIRELRFPSAFTPPKPRSGNPAFEPTSPADFDVVNTGWTIRFSAKQHGRVVAIAGVADYIEADMPKMGTGAYGPLGAPIRAESGELLSPNVVHQPKVQTTTTRFQIFAVPGETYEVTLYRGAKPEKHRITVTTE